MSFETFVFAADQNVSVPVLTMADNIVDRLVRLKTTDNPAYRASSKILEMICEQLFVFLLDETSTKIKPQVKRWLEAGSNSTLTVSYHQVEIMFKKDWPKSLIKLEKLISKRS